MDVKIFQSNNLGFVVCEVDTECGCEDNHCITNPRMLQMFITPPSQESTTPQLQVQLLPMVYSEVTVGDVFETTLCKKSYIDVTEKFDSKILDLYLQYEGKVVESKDNVEDVNIFGIK